MSESLETEVKTNPQGDPITSAPAPSSTAGKKDPHAEAKRQKEVSPEYMFFEAPREREFITGSEAAKEAVRRSNVDMSVAYPITPQSETLQLIGVLYGEGYVKEFYRGEEEYGVMSAIAGASRAGVRAFTATAGPGTLRGIEPIASWPGQPTSGSGDVYLPCGQCPFGHPAGQYRDCLPFELRHVSLSC